MIAILIPFRWLHLPKLWFNTFPCQICQLYIQTFTASYYIRPHFPPISSDPYRPLSVSDERPFYGAWTFSPFKSIPGAREKVHQAPTPQNAPRDRKPAQLESLSVLLDFRQLKFRQRRPRRYFILKGYRSSVGTHILVLGRTPEHDRTRTRLDCAKPRQQRIQERR